MPRASKKSAAPLEQLSRTLEVCRLDKSAIEAGAAPGVAFAFRRLEPRFERHGVNYPLICAVEKGTHSAGRKAQAFLFRCAAYIAEHAPEHARWSVHVDAGGGRLYAEVDVTPEIAELFGRAMRAAGGK